MCSGSEHQADDANPSHSLKRSGTDEACCHRRTRLKRTPCASRAEPDQSMSNAAFRNEVPGTASKVASGTESELSESSEEPSSESSSEEDSGSDGDEFDASQDLHTEDVAGITNLRANRGKKPKMEFPKDELGPDIRTFLKDFLPQLKAANEKLERERQAGTLKDREIDANDDGTNAAGEAYIEMDLGLGVLEERKSDAGDDSSDSDSDNASGETKTGENVLAKLMGKSPPQTRPGGIQEIDETAKT